jgi:hypothetical protein
MEAMTEESRSLTCSDPAHAIGKMMIEANVATLVAAVSCVPGTYTFSSCGGHKNPRPGEAGPDEFYVCFTVPQNAQGWRALELLAYALIVEDVSLKAWCNNDEPLPGSLAFEIKGVNGADPDEAADAIYDAMCICEACRREHVGRLRSLMHEWGKTT